MAPGFDIDEFLFGTPSAKNGTEVPTNVPSSAVSDDAGSAVSDDAGAPPASAARLDVPVTSRLDRPFDVGEDEKAGGSGAAGAPASGTVVPAETGRAGAPVGKPKPGFDLVIATDGSCSGNPGPGGWAFAEQKTGQWASGGSRKTTNNVMELTALVAALEFAGPESSLLLRIDSQYVINSVTKWAKGWRKKGWKKADGKPVANRELIERALELYEARTGKTEVEWVRGHAGDAGNELVDSLAVAQTEAHSR
ncbi:ribonuclease HI [Arcanobacterium wilhelmae]|uniref:Ribonuclease H n=1 Tax=Arcanobacterium wilhelmae TaxID=1803177 RepID=A0ABT9NB71_9ACTO|nr:ribonuclease H [Arcanobacterium wilhelmae]MDP9800964.1 ribonuclease HI [Arcanobacterium wilhelmae]WFN90324.1 ribonuclease HI [Arcanobacterium wilhelmae]